MLASVDIDPIFGALRAELAREETGREESTGREPGPGSEEPDGEALAEVGTGDLDADRYRRAFWRNRDLLVACGLTHLDPRIPVSEELSEAVGRAFTRVFRLMREREEAGARLDRLAAEGGPDRALLAARNTRRWSREALVSCCIDRAVRERAEPETCRTWAEGAVALAEGVENTGLHARAWAELGNAWRIGEQPLKAERCFDAALASLEEGKPYEVYRAEVLSLWVSLLDALCRCREARAPIEEAIRIFRQWRLPHDEAKVLVQSALIDLQLGDFASSRSTMSRALGLQIDLGVPPMQLLGTAHNALLVFTEAALSAPSREERSRAVERSRRWVSRLAPFYTIGSPVLKAKLRWVRGRLAHAAGDYLVAETEFGAAVEALLDDKRPLAAAVASLDQLLVLARQGDLARVRDLAGGLCRVFSARGLESRYWLAHRALCGTLEAAAVERLLTDALKRAGSAVCRRPPVKSG